MSEPFDLERALDEQEAHAEMMRDREWLASIALAEVRDCCSRNAYEILRAEVGIRLPEIDE